LAATCVGESCCTTINVAPGAYRRGRSEIENVGDYYAINQDWEVPEHDAQVTYAFALDKFEVTVGRFRAFVEDYDAWHGLGLNPKVGAGAHPASALTGWQQIWSNDTANVPANAPALIAQLHCDANHATWTDVRSPASDHLAINCVNWYVAAMFCIWDGGRLPTETEWEYVAANGASNQLYPWGSSPPDAWTANFQDTDNTPLLAVGSKPAGATALGHLDMAGSVAEWVFDSMSMIVYQTFSASTCVDCSHTSEGGLFGGTSPNNVHRGGGWDSTAARLRSAARHSTGRVSAHSGNGMRCARLPMP
jgi:formylglycine-generating enzyme required for sulfatase activity